MTSNKNRFRFRVVVKKANGLHEAQCVDANTGEDAAQKVEDNTGCMAVSVSKTFNYETINGESPMAERQCDWAVERAFNNIIMRI